MLLETQCPQICILLAIAPKVIKQLEMSFCRCPGGGFVERFVV